MRNKIFNILSYGETLKYWHNYHKVWFPADFITIGVNDVGRYTEVDYLLLVDGPEQFTPERLDIVKRTLPYNNFVLSTNWMKFLDRCVPITLASERRSLKTLDDPLNFSNLPFSYNSPFIAAILAYRMEAQTINLFGIDFNTDSCPEYRRQNIYDWHNLYNALTKKGIKVFTCPGSQLEAFIPINPNINYQLKKTPQYV